jgi:glycosyltransferase involved in cell wall biosynthesis
VPRPREDNPIAERPVEMRVLIIEQASDLGHYLNYVQHLVQAFVPLGCEIVVAVPNTVPESAQFQIHLSPHQTSFRLEFIPSRDETLSRWRMMLANARAFRALIARVKPDAVYVPTLDVYVPTLQRMAQSLAWWLALRPRLPRLHCEALLLGLPAAYGMTRRPFFTKMAVRTMPFDVVHYVDPIALDWVLTKVGGKAGRKGRFIADPVEPLSLPTRSKARAMLRLPEHKKLVMSIGLQDHRKGVDYLIGACARWQPAEPASIVLAGKLSAQIRQLVTNEYRHLVGEGRLIVLDQYLSKEDFYACFAAGDLIAAPYRLQPHPSAIVLQAATAGKMVLAANSGWCAYMVPKFSLGRLCNPQDPEVLAEALDPALHEAEAYKLSDAAKRLVEFHRSENFVLQWRRELNRIMGQPEDSAPRDWNWVLNGKDEVRAQPATWARSSADWRGQ